MRVDSTTFGRPRESIFDGPSPIETIEDCALGNADFSSPLSNGLSLVAEGQCSVRAAVVVLNFSECPSTVVRIVVAVGIDAIKRIFRAGAFAHIGKEVLEAVKPAVANGYAATAIVRIADIGPGIATRLHCCPGLVFRCFGTVVSCDRVDTETTATTRFAAGEVRCCDKLSFAAFAAA